MQKMPFVLGLLVGAVVATAWAQIPVSAGPDSSGHAAIINPIDMMANTQSLPVENHDAI
jgi:hypothetical protein